MIGILQFGSSKDKERNLGEINSLIKRCDADLVVVPEYAMFDISRAAPNEVIWAAEPLDGPFTCGLCKVAREHSTYLVAGIIERDREGVYNTAALISPGGEVIGCYRKIHLFDAYGYMESQYFKPGNKPSEIFDIGKLRIAMAICFDMRFPELFRIYALRGADLIAVPSAWFRGPLKEETLAFLARARAHENTVYIALAAQYGENFTGRSMLIDPFGVVAADLGIGEKYIEMSIDLGYLNDVRKMLPILKLRRKDIYGID